MDPFPFVLLTLLLHAPKMIKISSGYKCQSDNEAFLYSETQTCDKLRLQSNPLIAATSDKRPPPYNGH